MIDAQLEALAAPTRREIYSHLLEGSRSVAELAALVPVSRPAVSQHLKVLVEAGLATVVPRGTRRLYSASPAGLAALRQWTDQMWELAMERLADLARAEKEKADA